MTQVYNWTGFYIGANGGGGWGHSFWGGQSTGMNLSGGQVGGTAGYNWQYGNAVFGVEGDLDWSNLKGSATTTLCPGGCSTSDSWLSTVRGRLGYAFGGVLPYVTGGLAVGDIRAATPGFAGASTTNAGWTVGGGLEVALPGNWSAKAEYLHVDLGHFNCGLNCGVAADRQCVDARQRRPRRAELSLRLGQIIPRLSGTARLEGFPSSATLVPVRLDAGAGIGNVQCRERGTARVAPQVYEQFGPVARRQK